MTKTCVTCRETLPLDRFAFHSGAYRRTRCNDCYKEYNNRMKQEAYDADRNREKWLRNRYHMTLDQYDALLLDQGFACAICKEPAGIDRNMDIDHDHDCCPGNRSCGKCIRGLLCNSCNKCLGFAKDSMETLKSAIKYLEARK